MLQKRAIPCFSAASSKFHGKRQSPQHGVKIHVLRNTAGSGNNSNWDCLPSSSCRHQVRSVCSAWLEAVCGTCTRYIPFSTQSSWSSWPSQRCIETVLNLHICSQLWSTLWPIKTWHAIFLGGFLHFLYQWKENTLQTSCKISNFTQTVFPHYLIKLKWHKTAHFEVNHHSITQQQKLSELFFTSCVHNVHLLHWQTHSHRFLMKTASSKLNTFYLN